MWQTSAVNSPYETLTSINYRFTQTFQNCLIKIYNSETDSVD